MKFGLDTFRDSPYADRTVFPAQSSVLDEDALLHRVVCQYDIPRPAACRFYCRGWSDVYRVRTPGATFYLKVFRPPHTRDLVETEAQVVEDLYAQGASVVHAVRRRDGRYASEVLAPEGLRPILMFEEAPATPLPSVLDPALCRVLGESGARLHEAMDGLERRYPLPVTDADSIFCELLPYAKDCMLAADIARLDRLVQRVRPLLAGLPAGSPDFGLCHRDLAPVNLRLDTDRKVVFFDLSEAGYTWRAVDLGRLHDVVQHRGPAETATLRSQALLQGYTGVRPAPGGFPEALPVLGLAGRIRRLLYGVACCPLRMGEEDFGQTCICRELAELEHLTARLDEVS